MVSGWFTVSIFNHAAGYAKAEMTAHSLLAEGAIAEGLWPLWICCFLGGSTLANCAKRDLSPVDCVRVE
jgi:hypothetical protein